MTGLLRFTTEQDEPGGLFRIVMTASVFDALRKHPAYERLRIEADERYGTRAEADKAAAALDAEVFGDNREGR